MIIKKLKDILDERKKDQEVKKRIKQCRKLIEYLNNYAEEYINEEYAYDARCVGSAPTVKKGMFVDKDKVKFEGTNQYVVPGDENYVTLDFTNAKYINSYGTDINYETDKAQMEAEGLWITGELYFLASRHVWNNSSSWNFNLRDVYPDGNFNSDNFCKVTSNGSASGTKHDYGLRTCVSLKSTIIKIVGGTGEDANNAYIIGSN